MDIANIFCQFLGVTSHAKTFLMVSSLLSTFDPMIKIHYSVGSTLSMQTITPTFYRGATGEGPS